MASRSSTISKMLKERQQGIFEREQEKEGRQHGETKEVSTGRQGQDKTTMYWNADTQQWQKQYIRLQPPTGKEQDDRLRIAANEQKRAKIEAQRDTGDIFPDLRGGEGDIPAPVIAQKEEDIEPLGGRYNPGIELGQIAGGDQTTVLAGMDAEIDRKYITDKMSVKNQVKEMHELNTATNNNYVTDYQTAIKQGVDQYYNEDMLGSDEGRIKKSNVFDTFEKSGWWGNEGETIGVIGRNARRAYDTAMHEAQIPTKDPVDIDPPDTTSKEIDIKPEPIEIENTGKGGEVFKPAPVSSLFDPYKNMV